MSTRNRLHNCTNPYQEHYKKVLAVCSAGLLRSPTAAVVLSAPPFNFNVRAAGLDIDHALIAVDEVLLHWCDEIVCMTAEQQKRLEKMTSKPIICLNIPDSFSYRHPKLIRLIKQNYPKPSVDTTNQS